MSGTNKIQISIKKSDGTIYVVGGESIDELDMQLVALGAGDRDLADAVIEDMARSFTPMAAATPPPGNYYTPQPQMAGVAAGNGAARTSTQPLAVKIPWSDKAQADPYLTPLKASKQAQWDPNNKQWLLMPGVDLTPFARWLPPGS